MHAPRNKQFRALMAILVVVYVLAIAADAAALMLIKSLDQPWFVAVSIGCIACGLALLSGLYAQRELARRALLGLAFLWLLLALKRALHCLLATYLAAKVGFPLDLLFTSLTWLIFLALPITIIYLAMAYPASPPVPPPGAETLTSAR
jgi:hypothetical protein